MYKKIPTKKNNRKPVSRKKQGQDESSIKDADIQEALVKALLEDQPIETEETEEAENSQKQSRHKADRSKMWQAKPNVTTLKPQRRTRKTVEDKWSSKSISNKSVGSHKFLWSLGVFICVLLLGVFFMLFRSFTTDQTESLNNLVSKQLIEKENTNKELLAEQIEKVTQTIEAYLKAETVEEKCKYTYKSENFKSDIEAYYEDAWEPYKNFTIFRIQPVIFNLKEYWQVSVVHENSKKTSYYLRQNDQGELLVDWKADVIFQENSIESFISTKSETPTLFRCNIEIDDKPVYNWGFTDKEYDSVKIIIPNSDYYFWGYIKKNSEVSNRLSVLRKEALINHALDNATNNFIIKIKFLKDTPIENTQYVLIDEIITNSWINTEE